MGSGKRMVWPEKMAFGSVIFGLKNRIDSWVMPYRPAIVESRSPGRTT